MRRRTYEYEARYKKNKKLVILEGTLNCRSISYNAAKRLLRCKIAGKERINSNMISITKLNRVYEDERS